MEPASPDLRQRLRAASRRLGLTAFWRWWAGELAPVLPRHLRRAVAKWRMRPVLTFEPDVAVLLVPEVANGAAAYKEAARIPLTADADATAAAGRAAIEALALARGRRRAGPPQVVVALPPAQILRKTITLPAAVEESLGQVLAYDLDRHTPFKPDEVLFDARIVGRDLARKEIHVDWAAALKSVIGEAKRRAEGWGANVVAVTPDAPGAAARAGTALNLLPASERPEGSSRRRWELWAPIALLAAAALFATALPLWQKRAYAIGLMQLASQGRVQADAASAVREQLERLTGDYNFALTKKYAYPSALQSVEDVTKLLPDDTWLTQLEVKSAAKGKEARREIVVRGESANAGRLISLFEESKLFNEAAPRSPTTKIQPGPGEIFDLGAQLKPLPPPPPVQLATAGSEATPAAEPAITAPAATAAPMAPATAPAAPAAAAATVAGPATPGAPTVPAAMPAATPVTPAPPAKGVAPDKAAAPEAVPPAKAAAAPAAGTQPTDTPAPLESPAPKGAP
jgi:general secretion pathway protein L